MKYLPRTLLALAATALLSCSSDPVTPRVGPAKESGYDASIELFSGYPRAMAGYGDQLYAGGDFLLSLDGDTWRPIPNPDVYVSYMWFAANGNLYAVDNRDLFRLRDGAWSVTPMPTYPSDLCGFEDGRIIMAAGDGKTFRFDGADWEADTLAITPSNNFYSTRVSGDRYDNVFACGGDSLIARFDGTSWHTMPIDAGLSPFRAMQFGSGPVLVTDFNGGLYELQGDQPSRVDAVADIDVVNMRSSGGDAFYTLGWNAGGEGSVVRRFDGANWTTVMSAPGRLYDVWVSRGGVLYALAENSIWRQDGADARRILTSTTLPTSFQDMWVSPEGTAFAVGEGVLRRDDSEWVDMHLDYITNYNAWSIAGRSENDFFVLANAIIHYYDGEWHWEGTAMGSSLEAIWVGEENTFAVGHDGRIARRGNDGWHVLDTPTRQALYDVSGTGGTAYAVGSSGLILRWQTDRWVREASPTSAYLYGVAAFDDTHALALGADGVVVVRDNRGWQELPRVSGDLNAVCVTSLTTALIAGDNGLYRFDGRNLIQLSDSPSDCRDLAALPRGDILACDYYSIYRYRRR